ncbi:SCO family protein [Paenibacillus thiaminolyticus]|uniref:SCO family protein n=1 Tax=Paenibacillus thiaminolyticus TaxID=49283 RepID=A0AAP9J3J6_PANTH|nr:SCO family protein [Paenibacillus thiaminolyticus]MCY9536222.1 SCO family protein [Paenibacillus thiaminolyticus]MCY9603513.1 SCO family protein [Paenibacillus thiaminolyticus]MCY9605647.1 SCO family protein [Paenibacillus thiaminolyticus]MCY9611852.1 SCO family protein [Paenibacillus thiaminolyticus]MCY9620949.1 SCO family protein [Paenibacillus thiaminolyticus]
MSWAKKYSFQIFLGALVAVFAIVVAILYWPREPDIPMTDKKAPDFNMQNVDGSTVTLADTNGKVRLFYFYFTNCPDVCPPTTYRLSEVQKLLQEKGMFGTDASIVSISFDPERDTLEEIKTWSEKYNADYSGWYFLRGKEEDVAKMMPELGSSVFKDEDGNFTHLNVITLVDQDGNIRKYYNANDLETASPENIAKDVARLVKA